MNASVPGATPQPSSGGSTLGVYSEYLELTRRGVLKRLEEAPASELLREYFARGKMLRAFLVFAASAAVGGRPERVGMAAEAIEILHAASLFHDDLIDHASLRRGLASLHKQVGRGQALVIGDELILLSFAALSDARALHPAARVLEASEALNRLARECCRGQFDELCAERWVSEQEYLAIVSGKTAAAFVAAGHMGGLLGGGDEAQVASLRAYARRLGIAFQIGDDVLDLLGESQTLGKPVGNSLAQGRPILPLVYLWEASSEAERRELAALPRDAALRDALLERVKRHGVLKRVLETQQRYLGEAIAALDGLREADGVAALRALATRAIAKAVEVARQSRG